MATPSKSAGNRAGSKARQAAEKAVAAKAAPPVAARELPPGAAVFILSDQHIGGMRVPAGSLAQLPDDAADAYIKAGAADGSDAAVEAALVGGACIIDLREALTPADEDTSAETTQPTGS